MEIVNALTQSTSPNVGASTTKASTVSADFETFLKMLTAQIQNQDPMNPIDSSDYATQLATFSSVEQQVLANSYLENIQSALSTSSLASVADWIGKSAKIEEKLWFDGNSIDFEFDLPIDATRVNW
jgi:flagellar basal-body rod modification protein FlgD